MNTEMRRVESSENWYTQQQLRFDRDLVRFRYLTVEPYLQGPHGLELGSGDGSMTAYLRKKFKLLTVTNRINEHMADYAQDYIKIKNLALKEKQIKAIGKWFEEKIKETFIKINGEYRDCVFTNNWLKK